jgi:hypothetical protein
MAAKTSTFVGVILNRIMRRIMMDMKYEGVREKWLRLYGMIMLNKFKEIYFAFLDFRENEMSLLKWMFKKWDPQSMDWIVLAQVKDT